jgi:hypothetical protein
MLPKSEKAEAKIIVTITTMIEIMTAILVESIRVEQASASCPILKLKRKKTKMLTHGFVRVKKEIPVPNPVAIKNPVIKTLITREVRIQESQYIEDLRPIALIPCCSRFSFS